MINLENKFAYPTLIIIFIIFVKFILYFLTLACFYFINTANMFINFKKLFLSAIIFTKY